MDTDRFEIKLITGAIALGNKDGEFNRRFRRLALILREEKMRRDFNHRLTQMATDKITNK